MADFWMDWISAMFFLETIELSIFWTVNLDYSFGGLWLHLNILIYGDEGREKKTNRETLKRIKEKRFIVTINGDVIEMESANIKRRIQRYNHDNSSKLQPKKKCRNTIYRHTTRRQKMMLKLNGPHRKCRIRMFLFFSWRRNCIKLSIFPRWFRWVCEPSIWHCTCLAVC